MSPSVGPSELARRVRDAAVGLGFARIGFTPVERFDEAGKRLDDWLAAGHAGAMAYLAEAGADRADPARLLADARTLVVVALACPDDAPVPLRLGAGRPVGSVARYARGEDYHLVLKGKLEALARTVAEAAGRPVLARACVDTAPLLEREAARRAGVGFAAKSTMTIVPGAGTFVVLGELLVDVEIAPDAPIAPGCGSCRACLDVCPTGAFVDAHVLDARRCISYLTIELRGPIPRELRPLIGTRVFGCDVCQDVCPWNASSAPRPTAELGARPQLAAPDLIAWLELGAAGYRKLVRRTALRRVDRATLARNAAVALGNAAEAAAVPALDRALAGDVSPLVRGHAAWALGRLGGARAEAALGRAVEADGDASVRDEARLALDDLRRATSRGS